MNIIKAYHNKKEYEILAKGTYLELMPIFKSLIKQFDNESFIMIKEEYTLGYCYADFAHIKSGDKSGFVIALSENMATDLKNYKNGTQH